MTLNTKVLIYAKYHGIVTVLVRILVRKKLNLDKKKDFLQTSLLNYQKKSKSLLYDY